MPHKFVLLVLAPLLEKVAIDANGTSKVTVGENEIEFKTPDARLPILDSY